MQNNQRKIIGDQPDEKSHYIKANSIIVKILADVQEKLKRPD